MGYTNFPNGVTSFGVPLPASGIFGATWFVDGATGSDGNSGKATYKAFATIAKAVSSASAYDTIYVLGNAGAVGQTNDYAEAVTIPYAKPGIRLIGCGNSNSEGVLWSVGSTNDVILSVLSRDCLVTGFRFRPNGATSRAIEGKRSTTAATSDCSGLTIRNCVFRSTVTTGYAIDFGAKITTGGATNQGPNDVTIENCVFDSVLAAIRTGPSDATIGSRLIVRDVYITGSCTTGILVEIRRSLFERVYVADLGAMMLDTDPGGNAATKDNKVVACVFGDANSDVSEINATTTDAWMSSFFGDVDDNNAVVSSTTGLIIANPDGVSAT